MKLLTKEIKKRLPKLYEMEGVEDPIVQVKFFNPCGLGTWYGIEYDEERKEFFGLVDLHDTALGYFSLEELESLRVPPFGLKIERDKYFKPKKLSEVKESIKKGVCIND
jgi:hypothetical protein